MCTAWLVLTGRSLFATWATWRGSAPWCFRFSPRCNWPWRSSSPPCWPPAQWPRKRTGGRFVLLLLTNLSNGELVLGKLAGQPAERAGDVGGRLAGVYACGPAGRRFLRADRPGVRRHAGQRARLRQPGLDVGPVAGEDLPGPGHDRAGAGALAGGWARSWPPASWATAWPDSPAALGRGRSAPGRRSSRRRSPTCRPQPALGPLGTPVHLFLLVAIGAGRAARTAWPWPWCAAGIRRSQRAVAAAGEEESRRQGRQSVDGSAAASRAAASSTRRVWDNPDPLAGNPHLGLWAEDPGDPPGLFAALRPGRRRLACGPRPAARCDDRRPGARDPRAAVCC